MSAVDAVAPARPSISYPENLPITERREELLATLRDHQVVIVAGETGSGKSTQLPKLCLELGRGAEGKLIGHTQPRRLAARTIAERVAHELGSELGSTVGYQVRFTDRMSDRTLLKVMTDGILLAETQRDRDLRRYDTIIIDEAHERSLNIDFLLGYLKQLLPRRPDLKLIITSATIDTARFSEHFGGAPIVEVSGRTYPVELRYRPFGIEPDDDRDQTQAICDAVEELWSGEGRGDILVFLSGEREIHDTVDALRRMDLRATDVLPLYARLAAAEQHRIFQPQGNRRVVVSTNVAETSLTVPGVRYVIDAGAARISRYNRRLKVQRLPIEPISQASANQRAGRCGRVAPGICIRLYDEDDFAARPEFTEPEILRTNLASVILQMTSIGLGDIAAFPFVEAPDSRSIADGVALLEELGALQDPQPGARHRKLTKVGKRLAQLPVDPRLGRMVLEADRLGCVREVLVIASVLSIQDPRERPSDKQQEAAESHRRFVGDDGSDFLALVRLWDHLRARQKELSSNQFRKLCRTEFLNYLRVREWQDLYSQLRQVAGGMGVRMNSEPAHPDHVHQALLSGLLSHIGLREEDGREFRGARNAKFMIAPGSALTKKPPRWVMAGELVETNRLWGRVAARIQPEWAERIGAHLVKRTYSEPSWDAQRAAPMTLEKVLLYGLPIVAARSVNYGRVDPAGARAMFIHHALMEGDWQTHHPFVEENRALVDELRTIEERVRRRDLVDIDANVFAFYDRHLGPDIVSGGHFERWWKAARKKQPDLLTMTVDDVLGAASSSIDLDAFPETWHQGDVTLPVSYVFEPGNPDDGATVHIALPLLNQVSSEGFEWLVPGLRTDLVTALVRSLPKPLRRAVTPVNETVAEILPSIEPSQGGLYEVLAAELTKRAGERIRVADFDPSRLPDHLRMTFAVEDRDGGKVARSKDLGALKEQLLGRARVAIARAAAADNPVERRGWTDWEPGFDLPPVVEAERAGHAVKGFPALVDDGDSVSVRVLTNDRTQQLSMRAGTRRLLLLTVPASRKQIERRFDNDSRLAIARLGLGKLDDLVEQCVVAAIDRSLSDHGGPMWSEESFRELQRAVRADVLDIAGTAAATAAKTAIVASAVRAKLDRLGTEVLLPSVGDALTQLQRLVHPTFVAATGVERLADVHRYVQGIARRIEKLPDEPMKDRQKMVTARRLEQEYTEMVKALPADRRRSGEVIDLGWQLEELRIALFAQTLGTKGAASEQKLRREIVHLRQG